MSLGIRSRIAFGSILIILLTVLVMEALIINIVRVNYYNNLEAGLYNQLKVACEIIPGTFRCFPRRERDEQRGHFLEADVGPGADHRYRRQGAHGLHRLHAG